MIDYFDSMKITDFKQSKKFWQFYSASIKIKSENTAYSDSIVLKVDDNLVTNPENVADEFNKFFNNLSSKSLLTSDICTEHISKNFQQLKKENCLKTTEFAFSEVTESVVLKLLMSLDPTTSAGVSGIPVKILKSSAAVLAPSITKLFNFCLRNNCKIKSVNRRR